MRALLLIPVAVAGLALAGCGTPTAAANRGIESTHQPIVARTDYAIDVDASADGVAPAEDRRLSAWLDAMRIAYGDRITVDGGTDIARAAIAGIVARHGLLLGDAPPVTAGAVPGGMIRVIVSRSTASVAGCPDWSSASRPYVDGSTDSNYGCATNNNLAAMVADPQDLVAGRHGPAALSTRASVRALKAYDDLVPTGLSGKVVPVATGDRP